MIILLLLSLFNLSLSYYYVRYNSMIYSIKISTNSASKDFLSLFPYDLTFTNSLYPEYYIIGRAPINYESSLYLTQFTYFSGDIALLKDGTYAVFKEICLYERESIYIGSIVDFNSILSSLSKTNINTGNSENNKIFQSDNNCSPFIFGINGENDIRIPMDKEEEDISGDHEYFYGEINFSTRGTEKLTKVPPIYLNNSYLGDDCSIESDKYSIRCRIKDSKWYHVDAPKPVVYKVNELYEGCHGPVFTGITLYVSGNNIKFNLFLILSLLLILF